MHAAWLICAKDLKARLRDRSALLIGIVVPLALAFIFNVIFSGVSGSSGVISLGVVDADLDPPALVEATTRALSAPELTGENTTSLTVPDQTAATVRIEPRPAITSELGVVVSSTTRLYFLRLPSHRSVSSGENMAKYSSSRVCATTSAN